MWGMGLVGGLRITMRNLIRGPITMKYPYEKWDLPERSRWAVVPKLTEDDSPKCTACMACVRVCPDHILDLEFEQREDKSKHIDHFRYELGACMMCGLCVEACPFDAIEMSHNYELAVIDAADMTYDLLADVGAASARRERPERPAKTEVEGDTDA